MRTETPSDTHGGPSRSGWRPWLQVFAIALALLLLSEVVWLWQTWPVRALLAVPPPVERPAVAR